ncbi:MAG: DUF5106 domain-containing protein [Bacteroidales bacterium]|nr:DUF5106 domain-containing protein [Bacteroidales bacterium]
MKKAVLLLFISLLPYFVLAQGFTLTINADKVISDTLRLQTFQKVKITDANNKFEGKILYKDIIAVPCEKTTVFKLKKPLSAGYYQIAGKDGMVFPLLISNEKKQKITVSIKNDEIIFSGSVENQQNMDFQKQMDALREEQRNLNTQFDKAQTEMSAYDLQKFAQKLQKKADSLGKIENAIKERFIGQNQGTLLASIIQFSMPIENPPAYMMKNADMRQMYYIEHTFDNYPFEDARMAGTPSAMETVINFCSGIFYMDPVAAAPIAEHLLSKAQVNATNYHAFFNVMESAFGTIGVSFWTEEIYLTMLDNALHYNQLEERRIKYYQQVYELQSKNLPGTQIANVDILWADGTQSSLYDVQSEYTLLYLQNPDCHTCTAVREYLTENEELTKAVQSGKLKVVTLYFDKDEALWRRYLKTKANPSWQHGWDFSGEIEAGNLFDLRTIPVIFLLDKDKKVIRKNIAHFEISDYLKRLKIAE